MKLNKVILFAPVLALSSMLVVSAAKGDQSGLSIFQATLMEPKEKTPNISTEELRKILADKSVTVFDSRSLKAYEIDHIPGAVNARGDISIIGRAVQGNKAAPIVLYCNGPFCGQSKRVAKKLLDAGYTNVRRYQLGIPVWRALGGITERELEGVRYIVKNDQTAVFIDARDPHEFKAGTIPGARNLPRSAVKPGKGGKEVKKAKKDGRLPSADRNTRIIVFGRDGAQARAVAEPLSKNAFHNTSYFGGTYETLRAGLKETMQAAIK